MDTLPQWDGVDRVTPAGAAHLEKAFWINGSPLDAGNGRPVGRTHGPLRQCSGPYVGEPYAGASVNLLLSVVDARRVERLLHGQF